MFRVSTAFSGLLFAASFIFSSPVLANPGFHPKWGELLVWAEKLDRIHFINAQDRYVRQVPERLKLFLERHHRLPEGAEIQDCGAKSFWKKPTHRIFARIYLEKVKWQHERQSRLMPVKRTRMPLYRLADLLSSERARRYLQPFQSYLHFLHDPEHSTEFSPEKRQELWSIFRSDVERLNSHSNSEVMRFIRAAESSLGPSCLVFLSAIHKVQIKGVVLPP